MAKTSKKITPKELDSPGNEPSAGANRTKRVVTKTSQAGTKEGETRATFIVNEAMLEKLKSIAYWDRVSIKEVVHNALDEYLIRYEKKNGPVNRQNK